MPTTEWILHNRPVTPRPAAGGPLLGQNDEWESAGVGQQIVRVRTLFLRGSECRFHCTMCDLWQGTYPGTTQPGELPQQIRQGLRDVAVTEPRPRWLKLYNASSFFDPKNVPPEDLPEIARLVGGMQRVIVENHPRLVNAAVLESFCRQIQPAQLEVAMGLETIHADVLRQLNKQMTVDDFRAAVDICLEQDVVVRGFVLLQTPWLNGQSSMEWCQRTIDAAQQMGVQHISLIPVRLGNGTLEQLMKSGEFVPPKATMLEQILEENLSRDDCLVTVDLWDWDKLVGTCSECSEPRRSRLADMNLHRKFLPAIGCSRCNACEPGV